MSHHPAAVFDWESLSLVWSVVACAPFALMLLAIAVLPLAAPHFWESNRNKLLVATILGLPVAVWLLLVQPVAVLETALEYGAFIALLGSLFVISGGIYVEGSFAGTPLVNSAFLGLGSILASFLGTTGASMVLIRPLLRANRKRRHKAHIVLFFIFVVSNVGGCLTPLGDPPLFLGFLRGVPFAWTLRLLPQWFLANGVILVIFNLLDQYWFDKEDVETRGSLVEDVQPKKPFRIHGWPNLFLLGGVLLTVFSAGQWLRPWALVAFGHLGSEVVGKGAQIVALVALATVAWFSTPDDYRKHNDFHWHPITEVAALFAGIFAAMMPALRILEARGAAFGLDAPWQYFWLTGALSAFLDNAPTYLTFLAVGQGAGHVPQDLATVGANPFLMAISCGAVFLGAMTYIGNGPNFMVKAIADHSRIKMPGFFGYLAWTSVVLLPVFALVTVVFFVGG